MEKWRKSRKLIVIFCTIILLACLMQSKPVIAAGYGLNKTSATIYTGSTVKLSVTGVNGAIKWSTANKKIATVSISGKVKGIKAGKTTVTAKVGSRKFTCNVIVKNPALSKSKVTIVKGKSYTIKLNGTSIKKVSSSNKNIATVNSKGKITARKKGTCKLTIMGKNGKKYICNVKVETPTLSNKSAKLVSGQSITLRLSGNTQKITWSSADKQIASVDGKGVVKAKNQGVTKITAKVNTASYTCILKIVDVKNTYTKAEWVYLLMQQMNASLSGNASAINYYFADTKGTPYGVSIETAYAYGILPDDTYQEDVPRFNPNATATREFAAVSIVRALGYSLESANSISCIDASDLNYPKEDYIAVKKGVINLIDGAFLPDNPVMSFEKGKAYTVIKTVLESTKVTTPVENTTYSSGVVQMKEDTISNYMIKDNENGTYQVILPSSREAKEIRAGSVFVLPANEEHPSQIALVAMNINVLQNGNIEIQGKKPANMAQVVSSIEFAGQGTIVPEQIEQLDRNVKCTYLPNGTVKGGNEAYYVESVGAAYQTIGGEISMPGKLHFDLGSGIKLGKNGKLKGTFDLEIPNITAKMDLDCSWSGIKIHEATASITEKAKTTVLLEYTAAQSEMAPGVSGTKELTRVPFPLGATGLSLDLVVSLFYDAKGKVSITYTLEATQGIQYKDGDFRYISEFKNSLDLPSVEASAKAGLQLGLNITAFEIWDIIGVDGKIGPGVTASMENHITEKLTCVDASLYMYLKIELNPETILGEFTNNVLHYQLEKTVYDQNSSPLNMKFHFENSKKVDACTYGKGKIEGYVYDGKSMESISGARIKLYFGGVLKDTVYSDSNGKYTISNLSPGTYNLAVSATDYSTFNVEQKVEKNSETYVESALMLLRNETDPAKIEGSIIDAVTGGQLSGVTVRIRKGWNQTSGTIVKELYADRYYNFWIEPGNYTLQAVADDYVTEAVNVAAVSGKQIRKDISLVPKNSPVGTNKMRIVLTWGVTPYDLDAHLFGPLIDGEGMFHTYWYKKNYYYGNTNAVNLDLDDRYSYGPETTTVNMMKKSGIYSFYVHDYSNRWLTNSQALSLSSAKVVVYLNGKHAGTFHVPAKRGGTVWHVFDYDAAAKQIIPRNKMRYSNSPSTLRDGGEDAGADIWSQQLDALFNLPNKEDEQQIEELDRGSREDGDAAAQEIKVEDEETLEVIYEDNTK